jgi:hypothetical protein
MYPEDTHVLLLQKARNPGAANEVVGFDNDFITLPLDDTTGIVTDWVIVADAGATLVTAGGDGLGGWIVIAPDGDDNDEKYLSSGSEAFIFNTTAKVAFEARVKLVQGTTAGKSTFVVGLSDTVAANSIVDGGTLMTSFDGALFHKNEDATQIKFTTSNAGTQVTNDVGAFTNDTVVKLGFLYDPNDGVTGKISPIVNGVVAKDSDGVAIVHDITISGLAEMHILLGAKQHETGNEPVLWVDRVTAVQEFAR